MYLLAPVHLNDSKDKDIAKAIKMPRSCVRKCFPHNWTAREQSIRDDISLQLTRTTFPPEYRQFQGIVLVFEAIEGNDPRPQTEQQLDKGQGDRSEVNKDGQSLGIGVPQRADRRDDADSHDYALTVKSAIVHVEK